MPRAFIAICRFGELLIHVKDCPESSSFACWLLGVKYLPKLELNDQVVIGDYTVYTLLILLILADRNNSCTS